MSMEPSECAAGIPGPIIKKDEFIAGRSGQKPCMPLEPEAVTSSPETFSPMKKPGRNATRKVASGNPPRARSSASEIIRSMPLPESAASFASTSATLCFVSESFGSFKTIAVVPPASQIMAFHDLTLSFSSNSMSPALRKATPILSALSTGTKPWSETTHTTARSPYTRFTAARIPPTAASMRSSVALLSGENGPDECSSVSSAVR